MGTKKNTLMITCLLFVALLFSSCATTHELIYNAKEGKSFNSNKGMLAGALRWKQADTIIEPTGSFFGPLHEISIKNINTNIVYIHSLKKTSFYLALDPGTYNLNMVSITRIQKLHDIPFNKEAPLISNTEMFSMGVSICLFPRGGPPPPEALSYMYPIPFPSFQINEHEATYIGTLIVEVPDPLPDPKNPITPSFTFIDDQAETLNEFSTRFPGIERVKNLVPGSLNVN